MSVPWEVCDLVYGFAEEQDFQQVLNLCSSDDLDGLDYMAVKFHHWLQEPGRLVYIARMNNRVVALVSALFVDGGQTVVFQGLRVATDLRGRGIAGALQRHLTDYIRCHYTQVSAVRLSRENLLSPQTLAKNRLIAKEAILPLCCEAADLGLLIAEIRSRLPHQADRPPPVTLSQQQAETLIMSDHVVSNLLPGKTIMIGWEPLKPMKANLEVLRRRGPAWIVDREFEPTTLGLCTTPHAVPCRPDALHFNINIFGCSLDSVCDVFLAHLEALQQRLRGCLMFYIHVEPAVLPEFRQICQNTSNASLLREYFEELLLERDV